MILLDFDPRFQSVSFVWVINKNEDELASILGIFRLSSFRIL